VDTSAEPELKRPRSGVLRRGFALVGGAFCVLYLLNPGFGIVEVLQDNIPIVGNLDEAGATAFLIWAWRELFPRRRS
jgi:hypothetical protein